MAVDAAAVREALPRLKPDEQAELLGCLELGDFVRVTADMAPAVRRELADLVFDPAPLWMPLPGPQLMAWESEADELGFGGAAGGGKTDLVAGLTISRHQRTLITRREKAQTEGIVQRMTEILGGSVGYNSQKGIWKLPGGRLCEFAGLDNPGDERRQQGRPRDLHAFDEVTEMREHQVRFIKGWNRSADPDQARQVLMTFNPPTTAAGRWVLDYFGPWLLKSHPLYPAEPGRLLWAATLPGEDGEFRDAWFDSDGNPLADRPFVLHDGRTVYDFDHGDYAPEDIITPRSRTFIPSRVTDNPYYMDSGYISTLQALPEPLRSQMLFGDFAAGIEDDPWQVIPTAWVEAAQKRWRRPEKRPPMDSMGVDVAMGGRDSTIIARRHGMWFDEPIAYPGSQCPDGPTVAGYCMAASRDGATMHLDLFGVGAQPYGHLRSLNQHVVGVNVGDPASQLDASGRLGFFNLRSQLVWRMREALDPAANTGICLPPSPQLLADLCAYRWAPTGNRIKVAGTDEMKKALGRSPDWGSAYVLALMDTPKRAELDEFRKMNRGRRKYDPYANV